MSIKSRLLSMFLMIIGAFTLLAVYTVVSFLPIPRISKEFSQLRDLSEVSLTLRGDVNSLSFKPLAVQYKVMSVTKQMMDDSFGVMENFRYLPHINSDVADALEKIDKLKKYFDKTWDKLNSGYSKVIRDGEKYLYSRAVKINDFFGSSFIEDLPEQKKNIIMADINNMVNAILSTEVNLTSAYGVMRNQFALIDSEIRKREVRIIIAVGIVMGIIIFVTFLFSVFFSRRIGSSIITLENGIKNVQEGDLTTEFKLKSRDEIGRLGRSMKTFTHELSDSVQKIKKASDENVALKEELLGFAMRAARAVL